MAADSSRELGLADGERVRVRAPQLDRPNALQRQFPGPGVAGSSHPVDREAGRELDGLGISRSRDFDDRVSACIPREVSQDPDDRWHARLVGDEKLPVGGRGWREAATLVDEGHGGAVRCVSRSRSG